MFRVIRNIKLKMNFSHNVKNSFQIRAQRMVVAGFTTAAIATKLSEPKESLEQKIEIPNDSNSSCPSQQLAIEPRHLADRRTMLIENLVLLDRAGHTLKQSDKDDIYKKIILLRPACSKDFDAIGYNQLHWAIFCNQPVSEINRLIKENIDVNQGTEFAESIVNYNITPLHIAIKIGSKELAKFLLENGANKEYELHRYLPLYGPLSGNNYSTVDKNIHSAADFALHEKNATFRLFENILLENHINELLADQNEYNSILPSSVAACLYYSNKDELKAARKLDKLLTKEPDNVDKLMSLKNKYPAVEQNQLGEIYDSSIKARR